MRKLESLLDQLERHILSRESWERCAHQPVMVLHSDGTHTESPPMPRPDMVSYEQRGIDETRRAIELLVIDEAVGAMKRAARP